MVKKNCILSYWESSKHRGHILICFLLASSQKQVAHVPNMKNKFGKYTMRTT